ncbi:Putative protein of unknown function [Podospora comata]|uniref:Carbohydrate-binding module family 18 protein n=1 Tax=Podospora comata TaxID=48703 RepID=A0ABY6SJ15_PODCO|nr:Putative protein of unknown function [Podospora comata]
MSIVCCRGSHRSLTMKRGFSTVVRRAMLSTAIFRGLLVSALAVAGASAECTRFIEAYEGDTCAILAEIAGITVTQFLRSNPSVTSCSQLVTGGLYCIEGIADSGPTASASRTTSAAPTSSSPVRLTISQDGTCGSGVTCTGSSFGNCCSQFGFCGSSADYCLSDGCQRGFGSCGAGAISSASSAPITPGPTASVTVTVTSVVAVTRTSIVSQTNTATVTTTVPQTVVATRTITNTVPATAFTTQTVRVTSTTTLTTGATAIVTRTVDLTLTSIVTRTATVPVTATLTTVITNLVEVTVTSTRSSTTTTTTTRTVQTVVPVTQTLTTILTSVSVSTRVLTSTAIVTSGTCGTPTTRAPATTTTPSGSRPTLPGTPSNCKNLAVITQNDTCRSLASRANLTLLQFYDLNPSVSREPLGGEDDLNRYCTPEFIDLLLSGLCQINCDQLWEGYYVCVGR